MENTKYYVRTYATNSTATVYGEQIIITTLDGLAVVTTDSIAAVTATGFTAYGTVVSDCDIPVTARGFCYSTKQYPTIEDSHSTTGKGLGSYKSSITNLTYGTTYYVRAYATNETETTYGKQITITTLDGLPTVKTAQVTNIGSVKATCGGEVTDDGTLSVTARGVCYGTEQQPTIEGLHTTNGKGLGTFSSNLTNLKDKTTYYIRAYATTDAGTTYGEERSFKTENGIPVVELDSIGTPTANSVVCYGNVTGDGGLVLSECGICYSTAQYPTNTSEHVVVGKEIGQFTGTLTGLALNTTYYVRAYAVNSLGVGYSDQKTFTTKDGLATVSTEELKATATTITAGGEITDNGGYAVSERGVCYSTTNSEPTTTDEKVISGKGNGAFSASITGLNAATKYYVRAYATNENGTSYGNTVSITTKNGIATISVGTITNITALTATGSVTVTDAGGAIVQSCGICWSTNQNPTTANNKTVAGGKLLNTAYLCNMLELTPNTTYYVRAYASTDITTAYSEQKTFTTKDGLPTISTTTTTATSTTISSGGTISSDGGYSIAARGVCYSTTNSTPTIADKYTTAGIGTGTFSTIITNVSVSTTYYVRAYASNSIGTSYGNIMIVTTANGLPKLTTTTPTLNGTTVISGGQITSDEGFGITARGICYGSLPNPDLSSTYHHTSDGTGTGYFTSSFSLPNGSGKYYIRAYATNKNGTTYGDQVEIIQPYDELPTFIYNGHTYKVAPMYESNISYNSAVEYVNGLSLCGFNDWKIPDQGEMLQMCNNKTEIGGFPSGSSYSYYLFWTSTYGTDVNVHINIRDCNVHSTSSVASGASVTIQNTTSMVRYYDYYMYMRVRPVRIDK